ncbi:hypothetical protein L7G72_17805 [Xenorhabdus bovienii]|uniref:hypothetical protein n=1 Tax=Xenorhabdus bovienii TaxID=40576 RepID=UPI001EDE70D4|nr:hypothetical protein [Xenorhabdus bovienii]MCG3463642.1 hypothetical protein [Xenorhabdus bovienii]
MIITDSHNDGNKKLIDYVCPTSDWLAELYATLLNAIISGRENESISRFNGSFQSIVTASNDTGE